MKIRSVHVDNFGKLSDFQKDFDASFDCIKAENGWGKTTLAAFICAMLYGMDPVRKNNKDLKPRERYAPWQGGRYGGSVEIEKDGNIYRIERTFGVASNASDTLKILDMTSGMKEISFEETPGEHFLGLGQKAFLRTAFLSGGEEGDASELLPRLNKSINGTEQAETYKHAKDVLEDEIKKYKAFKGDKGILKTLEEDLVIAEKTCEYCRQQSENLDKDEKLLREKLDELKALEEKLERVSEYKQIENIRAQKLSYKKKAEEAQTALDGFEAQYGKERASSETLEKCAVVLTQLRAARLSLSEEAFTPAEKDGYDRLCARFGEKAPTFEDLDGISAVISDRDKAKEELLKAQGEEEDARLASLEEKFRGNPPSEEDAAQLGRLCAAYESAAAEREERLNAPQKKAASGASAVTVVLGAAGLMCIVAGIVFAVFGRTVPFIVLATVGALLLAAAVVFFIIERRRSGAQEKETDDEDAYLSAKNALSEKLALYGYTAGPLQFSCAQLLSDREDYLKRKEESSKKQRERKETKERIDDATAKINAFFAAYPGINGQNDAEKLKNLRDDLREYLSLERRAKESAAAKEKAAKQAKAEEENFALLIGPYQKDIRPGKEDEALKAERELVYEYRRLKQTLLDRKTEEADYDASHSLPDELPVELPDDGTVYALKTRRLSLADELSNLRARIDAEGQSAARLDESLAAFESLKEKRSEALSRYDILTKTARYLDDAENRLLTKYTEPIRTAYEAYAERIDEALTKGVSVSAEDLSLRFERRGAYKKAENFSSGFLALSEICLRIAMIEAAYKTDLPFLVLDDPFAYLDDENARKALEVLKDLSSKTQILYLTCHSSRAI